MIATINIDTSNHQMLPVVPRLFRSENLFTGDPESLFGLSAVEIVDRMPKRTIELVPGRVNENKPGHSGVHSFYDLAKEECMRRGHFPEEGWEEVVKKCDVHHLYPRAFGGSNNHDNMQFIDMEVHVELHRRMNQILTEADRIVRQLGQRPKRLLRWIEQGKDLGPLKEKLSSVEGLSFDSAGKLHITIPYVDKMIFIPQLLSRRALEGEVSDDEQGSFGPRYPFPVPVLATGSGFEITA